MILGFGIIYALGMLLSTLLPYIICIILAGIIIWLIQPTLIKGKIFKILIIISIIVCICAIFSNIKDVYDMLAMGIFGIFIYGMLFMPYIVGIIISVIIIALIRKKLIGKEKKFKILIYAVIIILCVLVFRYVGYSFMTYMSAKPDKVYSEMKEINDSEELIGLSKDEVITLLGKPKENRDDNLYIYSAGKTTNYFFFGEREFYDLFIWFDENDRVKSTKIDFPLGG